MKKLIFIISILLILASCSDKTTNSDAFGSFEATEIMISSEANGKIIKLNINEGERLQKNQLIAIIDTTFIDLQIQELKAQKEAIQTKYNNIDAQVKVIQQQIENLDLNIERVNNMLNNQAATQKQLDDLIGQKKVLQKQITALNTQKFSITKEINVLNKKKSFLLEQKLRCKLFNPISGTVLEKFAEEFEITAAGKPLYKIADLSFMTLKVYVSANQLNQLKIGETCKVLVDDGANSLKEYLGKITWISDKAEFTPKIIQTKEVRINLVYAVKIVTKNDSFIRIGMPGEAIFNTKETIENQ